jgi:hypothetical protein
MPQEAVSPVPQEELPQQPSKVAYLIGSGLTNATASRVKHGSEMVMSALFDDIIEKLGHDEDIANDEITGPLINTLIARPEDEPAPNLEELIDLLEPSGREACIKMGAKLSSAFGDVLLDHMKRLMDDLPENLAEILLDFYNTTDGPEELVGIITTSQ